MKNLEKQRAYIGTRYRYRGWGSEREKKLFKKNFNFKRPYNLEEILDHYSFYWEKSKDFHKMNEALWAASKIIKLCSNRRTHLHALRVFSRWIYLVDNWAHSDSLSSLLAELLDKALQAKDKVLITKHLRLRRMWNQSPHFWLRRQSIVSLLNYSRLRKETLSFDEIIRFVDPLCMDPAFYVQKAIGWTLRETYNLYPQKTYAYLMRNFSKISSQAFSSSTEKLKKHDKQKLLILRKSKRRAI